MSVTRTTDITGVDPHLSVLRRLDGSLLLVMRDLLRTGSATRTAERLALSQSAVSHALGRLRELFDDPLFLRRPHGLTPTRRAREIGPAVDALLALASELLDSTHGFDPESTRRLFRLSAPEFVAVTLGATLIRDMAARAPGCVVQVDHMDNADALRGLQHGVLDAALGRFRTDEPGEAFVCEHVYRDEYCLAARKGHPLVRRRISERRYRELFHVFAAAESEVSEQDRSVAIRDLQMCLVPRWLTALVTVAATDGVATCPRRLARSQADVLNLQVLDLPFHADPIDVSLVLPRGRRDPGADWFIDRIRAAVNAAA